MKIAIRKEPNGLIYIDKHLRDGIPYTEPPYNFTIIEVDEVDFEPSDFNDDLTFNLEKYNARKQKENSISYEQLVVSKIRERYTIDQELAILRQRDTKPQEFDEYNTYVESCKTLSKEELNGE
jgi:hypothetical protein